MSILLTTEPLDPGALLSAFTALRVDSGAIVSFTGVCRRDDDVLALELETYPGFADAAIAAEIDQVLAAHALQDLRVVHRVGRIAPGEAIVFVAAAAVHRREAFAGADRMMDFLKSRAPFWKREHRADGAHWIAPRPQDYEDAARWDAPAKER